jgi:CDP-2,3-bis-(O-geranylgeranyl)-sn-glycerol synthase
MAWWESVLQGLLFFLPAYVANMSPVFAARLVPKWNAPIDGGRVAKDGKRVLGPGKTWRGLTGGAIAGALTAVAVAWLVPPEGGRGPFAGWDYGLADGSSWIGITVFGAIVGFAALAGDAVKSYFKRRTGRDRGQPWVPFDQLDFVVFGLAAAFAVGPWLLADGWLLDHLLGSWWILGTIVLLTPLLHFLVNVIGYFLKLKEVPW